MSTSVERHLRRLAYSRAKLTENDHNAAEWAAIQTTEMRDAHSDGVSVEKISEATGLSATEIRRTIGAG